MTARNGRAWGMFAVAMLAGLWLAAAGASAEDKAPTTSPATTQAAEADLFKLVTVGLVLDKDDLPVRMFRTEYFFGPDSAFTFNENGTASMGFDLKKEAIFEAQSGRSLLADLRVRAATRRDDVTRDLDAYKDRELADRMKYTLRPDFKVTEQGNRLTLSNPLIQYDIELMSVPAERLRRIFLVDQMITFLRADVQNPPFANEWMDAELANRGSLAKETFLTMKVGTDSVRIRSTSKVLPLSPFERERLAPLLTKSIQ